MEIRDFEAEEPIDLSKIVHLISSRARTKINFLWLTIQDSFSDTIFCVYNGDEIYKDSNSCSWREFCCPFKFSEFSFFNLGFRSFVNGIKILGREPWNRQTKVSYKKEGVSGEEVVGECLLGWVMEVLWIWQVGGLQTSCQVGLRGGEGEEYHSLSVALKLGLYNYF